MADSPQQNSRLTALFLLMVLSTERDILNSSRVYNSNSYSNKTDMNISLTSNSVTE